MKGLNRQGNGNTREQEKQEVFASRSSHKGRRGEAVQTNKGHRLCGETIPHLQGVTDEVEQAV